MYKAPYAYHVIYDRKQFRSSNRLKNIFDDSYTENILALRNTLLLIHDFEKKEQEKDAK